VNLLSEDELQTLTKATQHTKQKRVLNENGIYFIERLDGSIVTTWYHVNHPAGRQASLSMTVEPNYGAIGNG